MVKTDQTPRSAASAQVLHYLPTSHKKAFMGYSQGPWGQEMGPVRIVCRFMVTYIETFSGVLPLI